jgi:hypothetical protein
VSESFQLTRWKDTGTLSTMEREAAMTDTASALKALEDAQSARAQVGQRLTCPPHMHAAFGLLLGTLIAGQALPWQGTIAVMLLCFCAGAWMYQWQRKRMGFFVNGYRRGRTRRVAVGLVVFVEIVLFTSLWLKLGQHIDWAPLVGGALVFPVGVAGSYAWQAAYRADLAGSTQS